MKIAVGTRFFETKPENKDASLTRIDKWIQGAKSYFDDDHIMVAVNVDPKSPQCDQIGSLEYLNKQFPHINAFGVMPWGKFVPALNAMVYEAARQGADAILFTSAEFPPQKDVVDLLAKHLTDDKLVVGLRLDGHSFRDFDGQGFSLVRHANGREIPWNTYALWNLKILALRSFQMIGDSPFDEKNAGVEELATMAELTRGAVAAQVVMLEIPSMSGQWDQTGWDAERLAKHEAKMASKVSRPAAQLEELGLKGPMVLHIRAA